MKRQWILSGKLVSTLLLLLMLSPFISCAQDDFYVVQCQSAEEVIAYVDTVLLSNVDSIFKNNIAFTGDPRAVGYYTGGELLGFNRTNGIVMSTGFAGTLSNSNNCVSQNASGNTSGGSDPDLMQMTSYNINDVCIIEFDLNFVIDSAVLHYVFGSEEYHDWVNTWFNDVFGLFVSGPGIGGPYTNDAENIAVVPGTSNPVSINTINCGQVPAGCNNDLPGGPGCNYLFDNTQTYNEQFTNVVLDAFTYPLKTLQEVQAEEWYHFKLAIGDAADNLYDSGIFLSSELFVSDSVTTLTRETNSEEIYIYPNPAKQFVILNAPRNIRIEEYSIFDLNGRLLRRAPYTVKKISLQGLPKGLLVFQVNLSGSKVFRKLVHQ